MDKCWKNPVNKGKGGTNKEREDKEKKNPASSFNKGKGKGKVRANVAEQDSSSDEELEKSFTAFINISDEGEMSKASAADFSACSWILDSGVTTLVPHKIIKGLGNKPVIAHGQGTVLLRMCINDEQFTLCLTQVLYVPEARQNLISVR